MKNNELRIGNLVYPSVSYPECIGVCAKDFEDTTHLETIPLTEEWLLKFGFKGVEFPYTITFDDWTTILIEDDLSLSIGEGKRTEYTPTQRIKNVHTLQNLYFALTGEELEIKN